MLNHNGEYLPLHAVRKHTYFAYKSQQREEITSLGFVFECGGLVEHVVVDTFPARRFTADTAFVPDPALWEAYTGTYEGVTTFYMRVENQRLLIKESAKEVPCTALDNSTFACRWGIFEFFRDENGTVETMQQGQSYIFKKMRGMSIS
jgi:hypothetical protein